MVVVDFMTFYWQKSSRDFIVNEAYDMKVKVTQWQCLGHIVVRDTKKNFNPELKVKKTGF